MPAALVTWLQVGLLPVPGWQARVAQAAVVRVLEDLRLRVVVLSTVGQEMETAMGNLGMIRH